MSRGQFNADSNFFTGWRVLIHDPAEFPEVNKKGIFVGSGQEVSIGVSGQTSESTSAVRAMSPERRKCLLRSETDTSLYRMTLFDEYKKSSCHFENTVFGLLKQFECLPYFMPRIPQKIIEKYVPLFRTNDSITCDALQMKAMAEKIALFSARSTGTEDTHFIKSGNPDGEKCHDECDSTKYSYQVSSADFEDNGDFFLRALLRKGNKTVKAVNGKFFSEYQRYVQDTFAKLIQGKKWNGRVEGPPVKSEDPRESKQNCVEQTVRNKIKKMTYLHVYFNSFGVTKFSKSELYGWQDLIGVFGGIVGLCMGFSLLSGAEFIYFFTVRHWVDNARNNAKKRTKKNHIKVDKITARIMGFE